MLDGNALRNMQGYLADCHRANMKPSVFQMMLFAYSTSTVLTPPFWVPIWLLVGIHHVLAYWIAQGLLGYVALVFFSFILFFPMSKKREEEKNFPAPSEFRANTCLLSALQDINRHIPNTP